MEVDVKNAREMDWLPLKCSLWQMLISSAMYVKANGLKEILEVTFHDNNIADLLDMTIDEAITFFNSHGEEKIAEKLMPLSAVGMGYICLGQSSSTLSGGEAQRIKLAYFYRKEITKNTAFLFLMNPQPVFTLMTSKNYYMRSIN